MSRVSNLKKSQIIEDYRSGNFTRDELATIYSLSRATINRILYGIKKPFRYDAMNKAVSLDSLKARGYDPPDMTNEPLTVLTKPPEYAKIVKCPSCAYRGTVDKLLGHLIKKHARYDLEYLL